MKNLFLVLSVLLLNSCGSLFSASLTETIFNPTSIASTLIDYEIKKHTGKKVSEHALSKATEKDCEINVENFSNPQSFCKDKEVAEIKLPHEFNINSESTRNNFFMPKYYFT